MNHISTNRVRVNNFTNTAKSYSYERKPWKIQKLAIYIFNALREIWTVLKNLRISITSKNKKDEWSDIETNLRYANCANSQKECNTQQEQIKDLRSKLENSDEKLSNLQVQLQKKYDQISGLNLDLSQHRFELNNLQADCRDKIALTESQKKLLEESAKKLKELENKLEIQASDFNNKELEFKLYKKEMLSLTNASKEKTETLRKIYNKTVSLFTKELEAAKQVQRSAANFSIGTEVVAETRASQPISN